VTTPCDDDQHPVLYLAEPGGDPPGKGVIGFAIGRLEIPVVVAFAVENAGRARFDLVTVETVPRPYRDFLEAVVKGDRREIDPRGLNQLGSVAGTS
jgi:hypothetical protein